MILLRYLLLLGFLPFACMTESEETTTDVSLIVLGTAQDAGAPQIGCQKACCHQRFGDPAAKKRVSCLGLVDRKQGTRYLFDATPDMPAQLASLTEHAGVERGQLIDGIFLTHAHMGHYTGLMYLGKEATDARQIPVYAMPRMTTFLSKNGPWGQLVSRENIMLRKLKDRQPVKLSDQLTVTPLSVPHRDEYSETVGYRIEGPEKSALFIPDIDKWGKWELDIEKEIRRVDYAFLDATFHSGTELNNRDMSQIPHPFIVESMERLAGLNREEKGRVVFIHFNHTNPVLDPGSEETRAVLEAGFRIAREGEVFGL